MKKILFFAATAMLFAACSNEEALAPQVEEETSVGALTFDVYTGSATRAGDPAGVMTTEKLKFADKGFGVFAFHHDNTTYPANNTTYAPNFMYNEHVSWTSAWTYAPLKYWPNETGQDSQTDNGAATSESRVDRLSFFAYAPYVSTGEGGTLPNNVGKYYVNSGSPETSGITAISAEDNNGDPKVRWSFSSDLDNNVDLLWGVAPMGMAYQSVNPTNPADPGYVEKTFGLPLLNMLKPDKDLKMKFLFNHALSRIGLSVVSAVDQIAAGDDGSVFNNSETRVLIEEVKVWGDFTTSGTLNLNNTTANVANWGNITKSSSTAESPLLTFDATSNNYIAKELRYISSQITGVGTDINNFNFVNRGVLPSETTLLEPGVDFGKKVESATPAYAFGTTLYHFVTNHYEIATVVSAAATGGAFEKDGSDNYQQACAAGSTVNLDGTTKYFTLVETASGSVAAGANYWIKSGSAPNIVYTKATAGAGGQTLDATHVTLAETELAASGAYASDTYYTGTPRYFMVIPSDLTPTPTTINIRIKYHVVTKDGKLTSNVSDVTNEITKTTKIQLESGKAYNLKLILGLTSVKLDATVADWQIDGSTEVWLPQNNE